MKDDALDGLYLITDEKPREGTDILSCVEAALRGGVRIVQYRDKSDDTRRRIEEAHALRELCNRLSALLLINDDIELAAKVNADGVHLGKDDDGLMHARRRLGYRAIIGISCYNDFARAMQAEADGADYVAFGSVFESSTKPEAPIAPLDLFERARAELRIPVCAIGGIHSGNISSVASAGADMFAVISALSESTDIESTAREMAVLIQAARHS